MFFSDEATIDVSGLFNKYKCRTWGSENSLESREMNQNSPKLNVKSEVHV